MLLGRILLLLLLLWVAVYTATFGVYNWKKKKRAGSIMIFIIALSVILLPVYTLYFKD